MARKIETRIFNQKAWHKGENRWHGCTRVSIGGGLVLEVRTADKAKFGSKAELAKKLKAALAAAI